MRLSSTISVRVYFLREARRQDLHFHARGCALLHNLGGSSGHQDSDSVHTRLIRRWLGSFWSPVRISYISLFIGDASILQKIGNQTNDMLKTLTKAQVKTRTDVKELVAGMRSDLL